MGITRQRAVELAEQGTWNVVRNANPIALGAERNAASVVRTIEAKSSEGRGSRAVHEAVKFTQMYTFISRHSPFKEPTVAALARCVPDLDGELSGRMADVSWRGGPAEVVAAAANAMCRVLERAQAVEVMHGSFGGLTARREGDAAAATALRASAEAERLSGKVPADVVALDVSVAARAAAQACLTASGMFRIEYEPKTGGGKLFEFGPSGELHASGVGPSYVSVTRQTAVDLGWHRDGAPHSARGPAMVRVDADGYRARHMLRGMEVTPDEVAALANASVTGRTRQATAAPVGQVLSPDEDPPVAPEADTQA